ncbi:formyltransferase family protein [Streptomyces sp. NPDC094448]|uniref:formyltransferase family protein n=1 Tax=Streptomyces sp. NPDC094448 TaxID=3366063 RepID=UPI003826F666
MRIMVCTERDVVTCTALNRLLPGLAGHTVMVAFLDPGPVDLSSGSPLRASDRVEREVFPQRVLDPLDRLPAPPGALLSFGHLLRRYGVPFHALDRADAGDLHRTAAAFAPDVILSLRFGRLFREPTLSLPPLGILNTHSGALPAYPGLSAHAHALLDGATGLTCTLHRVDAGIDTGPVVAERRLPFDRTRSILWHLPALYTLGAEMFLEALPGLAAGRLPAARPQERAARRYRSELSAEQALELERLGFRFVAGRDVDELAARFTGTATGGTSAACGIRTFDRAVPGPVPRTSAGAGALEGHRP